MRIIVLGASALTLVLVLGAFLPLAGQTFTRSTNPFSVYADGDSVALPFLGGINEPKPELVDVDSDGLLDLIIGELSGKVIYLRNVGSPASPLFELTSTRLGGIDAASWHIMADIDADGDPDFFCDNRLGGVEFHRNDNPGTQPTFTLIDSTYAALSTGVNNTPALIDIDADRDLDFFLGGVTGSLILYRNDGDSASPSFVYETDLYDSVAAFPGGGSKAARDGRHGFSCIHFSDINADDAPDLLWGDINNVNLYLFSNLGSAVTSDLTWVTDDFLPTATVGFNHATTGDIDNDGDPDLLVGVGNGATIDNLRFYRNVGDSANPQIELETANLIDNIDIGGYSFPAVGDIDSDGDPDLLVGRYDGRMTLFENTGTPFHPELTQRSDYFESIDVGTFAVPVLVDWDADGVLDLLIGTGSGRIEYWRNVGNRYTMILTRETSQLAGIQVDQYATPRVGDLNDDGLLDLVVGEWDFNSKANVRLYENTGSVGSPSLTLVTTAMLPVISPRDYALPQLYDWDGDGRLDLIIGTTGLGLTVWRNQTSVGQLPDSLSLSPIGDTVPGADDGLFPSIVFHDWDGDADDDALIGELNGGLNFWYRDGSCCVGSLGNVDADSSGAVDITDLTTLVDWLFSGVPLPCPLAGNVNADPLDRIDLSDLIFLVNRVFLGGPAPDPCP
ncbi:VCBS repeat-containing protein [bacterium]|nr:VCBS repeat-containing protein [bacterium]